MRIAADCDEIRMLKFHVFSVVLLISKNSIEIDNFTKQLETEINNIDNEINRQTLRNQKLLFFSRA